MKTYKNRRAILLKEYFYRIFTMLKKCVDNPIKIVLLILGLLIIILPVCINVAYVVGLHNSVKFNTFFSAGDLLGYIGSIFGSIIVLISIYITIRHEEKSRLNDQKFAIKPYLVSIKDELKEYRNDNINELFTIIHVREDEVEQARFPDLVRYDQCRIVRYTLKNIGAGNIVRMEFYINDQQIPLGVGGIAANDSNNIILIFDCAGLKQDGDYMFWIKFKYLNVTSTAAYVQTETVSIVPRWDKFHFHRLNEPQEIDVGDLFS